jgi:ribosomal protein S18 acetylase RimI-like enzyme
MNIKTLDLSDQDLAIDILARAFRDDPVMNWIGNKPEFIRLLFEVTMPAFMLQGLTFMAPDESGIATGMGPNSKLKWPFKPSNFIKALKIGGIRCVYRFAVSGLKTEKCHPKEPHYYLFAIGALPEFRGKGIGTALISQLLRKCDQQQVPAYLENSNEANLPFYSGHGFKVLEKIYFAEDAPPLWLMWREPGAGTQTGS